MLSVTQAWMSLAVEKSWQWRACLKSVHKSCYEVLGFHTNKGNILLMSEAVTIRQTASGLLTDGSGSCQVHKSHCMRWEKLINKHASPSCMDSQQRGSIRAHRTTYCCYHTTRMNWLGLAIISSIRGGDLPPQRQHRYLPLTMATQSCCR